MAKPKTPVNVPVLSLDEIATYSADDAADAVGHRYCARSRQFIEMGKLVFHLENRVKLAKGQTIYGLLQKRGVPESSVNNCRLVEKFLTAFVVPGLVTEARFDAICTFRVANVCARILAGKTAAKMTAEQLAAIVNSGEKSAIGDELDCLDEHGMTIAGRKESEEKKKADAERLATATAAAAKLAATAPATAPPVQEQKSDGSDKSEDSTPAPVIVDGTKKTPATPAAAATTPAAAAPPAATTAAATSHQPTPATTAEVLASIATVELQSYDLDATGLQAVRVKLAEWISLIDETAKASATPAKVKKAA